jgi:transcriptional regulator with XRE-family HTH domain
LPKTKAIGTVDIEVGRRIRVRRVAIGMSQTELADGLGLTFQQVQKYEKGVNRVGAGRLTQIAKILGVPIGAFFGRGNAESGSGNKDEAIELSYLVVPGAVSLVKAYSRIKDAKFRRSILDLVETAAAFGKRSSDL